LPGARRRKGKGESVMEELPKQNGKERGRVFKGARLMVWGRELGRNVFHEEERDQGRTSWRIRK